ESVGYPQYAGKYAPIELPEGAKITKIEETAEGLKIEYMTKEQLEALKQLEKQMEESKEFWTKLGYPEYAGKYAPIELPEGAKITRVKETEEGLHIEYMTRERPNIYAQLSETDIAHGSVYGKYLFPELQMMYPQHIQNIVKDQTTLETKLTWTALGYPQYEGKYMVPALPEGAKITRVEETAEGLKIEYMTKEQLEQLKLSKEFWEKIGYPQYAGRYPPPEIPPGHVILKVEEVPVWPKHLPPDYTLYYQPKETELKIYHAPKEAVEFWRNLGLEKYAGKYMPIPELEGWKLAGYFYDSGYEFIILRKGGETIYVRFEETPEGLNIYRYTREQIQEMTKTGIKPISASLHEMAENINIPVLEELAKFGVGVFAGVIDIPAITLANLMLQAQGAKAYVEMPGMLEGDIYFTSGTIAGGAAVAALTGGVMGVPLAKSIAAGIAVGAASAGTYAAPRLLTGQPLEAKELAFSFYTGEILAVPGLKFAGAVAAKAAQIGYPLAKALIVNVGTSATATYMGTMLLEGRPPTLPELAFSTGLAAISTGAGVLAAPYIAKIPVIGTLAAATGKGAAGRVLLSTAASAATTAISEFTKGRDPLKGLAVGAAIGASTGVMQETLYALPWSIGYGKAKIPTVSGEETIYKGVYVQWREKAYPLVGVSEGRIVLGTPKIPLQEKIYLEGGWIPTHPLETKIIMRNLEYLYTPEEVAKIKVVWDITAKAAHVRAAPKYEEILPPGAFERPEVARRVILDWAKEHADEILEFYGSAVGYTFLPKEALQERIAVVGRPPWDYDVMVRGSEKINEAVQELVNRLRAAGEQVWISPTRPLLLETPKGHAIDIHAYIEALGQPMYRWGFQMGQKPVEVGGVPVMKVQEWVATKASSILTLWPEGAHPLQHRQKDIYDWLIAVKYLLGWTEGTPQLQQAMRLLGVTPEELAKAPPPIITPAQPAATAIERIVSPPVYAAPSLPAYQAPPLYEPVVSPPVSAARYMAPSLPAAQVVPSVSASPPSSLALSPAVEVSRAALVESYAARIISGQLAPSVSPPAYTSEVPQIRVSESLPARLSEAMRSSIPIPSQIKAQMMEPTSSLSAPVSMLPSAISPPPKTTMPSPSSVPPISTPTISTFSTPIPAPSPALISPPPIFPSLTAPAIAPQPFTTPPISSPPITIPSPSSQPAKKIFGEWVLPPWEKKIKPLGFIYERPRPITAAEEQIRKLKRDLKIDPHVFLEAPELPAKKKVKAEVKQIRALGEVGKEAGLGRLRALAEIKTTEKIMRGALRRAEMLELPSKPAPAKSGKSVGLKIGAARSHAMKKALKIDLTPAPAKPRRGRREK
ncbi:MAG: hypothetical protein QW512_03365, partial [Thermofilaceae archaeon]